MRYKVTGEAYYEFEVQAEDMKEALSLALESFVESRRIKFNMDSADVLNWKVQYIGKSDYNEI